MSPPSPTSLGLEPRWTLFGVRPFVKQPWPDVSFARALRPTPRPLGLEPLELCLLGRAPIFLAGPEKRCARN